MSKIREWINTIGKNLRILLFLLGCSCSNSLKPQATLFIINFAGEKEKIADFYSDNGSCELVRKDWSKSRSSVWCEYNY